MKPVPDVIGLVLKCVRVFMRVSETFNSPESRATDHDHAIRLGIVEAGDLLGEQVSVELPQIDPRLDQTQ